MSSVLAFKLGHESVTADTPILGTDALYNPKQLAVLNFAGVADDDGYLTLLVYDLDGNLLTTAKTQSAVAVTGGNGFTGSWVVHPAYKYDVKFSATTHLHLVAQEVRA
jgi:hypothetical protein